MADSNDHHTELKDKPGQEHIISPERQSRSDSRHSTLSPADSTSPTKDGPSHSPNRKDREERIKILQEKRKEEQQKKLNELRQAQLQAQKVRERQEDERRRKIEELKARDEHRRAAVEERRRKLLELEKERREAFWKRAYEREAKIETVKAQQRHSMYAFGSSTSRFLGWEPAHTSRRAASQNNLNRKPLEKPAEKRSSSACSYDRQSSGKMKSAISVPILNRRPFDKFRDDSSPITSTPNNSIKRLSPFLVNAHRKRTDLVPAIPGTNRSTNLTSTPAHSPTSPSRSYSNHSDRSASSSQASASSSVRSRGTVRKPRPVSIAGTLPDHTPINTTTTISVTHNRKSRSSERIVASKPSHVTSPSADKSPFNIKNPPHRTSTPVKGPLKVTNGSPAKVPLKDSELKEIKAPTKPTAPTPPIKSPSPVSTPGSVTPHTPATTPAIEEIPMDSSFTSKQRLTCEEEAKAALAERRRLAREQAEREAELEKLRLEELERQEQENLRLEAEEAARVEAEQNRLAEEFRRSEEEKLRKAIEENDRRLREEKERIEEELKQKEEADKKAKEEADRLEIERLERARKEEEERIERKRRVEAIMKRTRKFDSASPKADRSNDGSRLSPDDEMKTDSSDKESPMVEKMDTSIQELNTPTYEDMSLPECSTTEMNGDKLKQEWISTPSDEKVLIQENCTSLQESSVTEINEVDKLKQKRISIPIDEAVNIQESDLPLQESITEINDVDRLKQDRISTHFDELVNTEENDVSLQESSFTEIIDVDKLQQERITHFDEKMNTEENDVSLQESFFTEIIDVDKLQQERISTHFDEKMDLSIKENYSPILAGLLIEENDKILGMQGNSSINIHTMTETISNVSNDVHILHDNGLASPTQKQIADPWNSVSPVVNSSSTKTVMSNGVDGNIINFMMDSTIFQPELSSNIEQNSSYESKTVRTSSLSDELAEFDMLTNSSEPRQQLQLESHQADFEELIDLSSFSNKNESKVGTLMDHLMNNEDDVNSNTVTSNGPTGSPLIAFDDNVTKKQDNVATDLL